LRTAYAVQSLAHHPLAGQSLFSGLYLNELLLRLLPREVPAPELYSAYGETLLALGLAPRAEPLILRRFEWACLEALGVAFSLREDVLGEPLVPTRRYDLDPGRGLYALSGGVDAGWSGAHLIGLAEEAFDDPAVRRPAQALMQKALAPHLGGRPLAAARFLQDAEETSS
jgi:Recombinational DNA repair protein (RecF pathway)